MEPWNIINSQGTGPYAVDTRIGWVVNGLLHENAADTKGPNHIFNNQISIVNLNDLLVQQYNHNYPEI